MNVLMPDNVHTWSCNCIGPQNGQPRCPCRMWNVKEVDGRWVETIDLGPVSPAPKDELKAVYAARRPLWLPEPKLEGWDGLT